MKLISRDRFLTWTLPILLAGVVVALAVLQYRWSRQVSDATSTRMQTDLQNSMMNFREDLNRQLGTICLDLQSGRDPAGMDAKVLTQNFEIWQRTSAVPGLIANLYEWDSRKQGTSPLLHLLTAESRFEAVAWPDRFERILRILSEPQRGEAKPVARAKNALHDPRVGGAMIGGIDQTVPVLVIQATRSSDVIWLLIELDKRVLEQTVFPQLAERYFGNPQASEYVAAVIVETESGTKILYSTSGNFSTSPGPNPDATLNLFGPPDVQPGKGVQVDLFRSGRGAFDQRQGASLAASGGTAGGTFEPIRLDPIDATAHGWGWQLAVRNRKGSVAAAVAELRLRNLLISFGVLVVLAASMALILFASQRARRLATLQVDFVAGVSHELRTPVAAILAISENIADGVVENQEHMHRYGSLIRAQARQLNHLVEQVLRFAAMQRKPTNYTIRSLQMTDVLAEVLQNLSSLIAASGFTVESNLPPELPQVRADFGVLSQCLQNLISNAIKYGGPDRWVGIRAEIITQGRGEISIKVEDHGIGIVAEELKHIFEPFYRSPKVIESQIHGTGLGLALARSFAESMGGHLTAESTLGKGSAFTLTLPVASG